jgi:hypothetical protein
MSRESREQAARDFVRNYRVLLWELHTGQRATIEVSFVAYGKGAAGTLGIVRVVSSAPLREYVTVAAGPKLAEYLAAEVLARGTPAADTLDKETMERTIRALAKQSAETQDRLLADALRCGYTGARRR